MFQRSFLGSSRRLYATDVDRPRPLSWRVRFEHDQNPFWVGLSPQRGRLSLGFNFSSTLQTCWGFSLGLTRESLRHHFRLMVRRIWPWAQPLQPSQPIIFALPPAPVSIASLASGGRFDMLMPSGAPDSAEIILMLFFLTAALAAWIFTEPFSKENHWRNAGPTEEESPVFLITLLSLFYFSSVTAASQIKLISQARPRYYTLCTRLSLYVCQDTGRVFFLPEI